MANYFNQFAGVFVPCSDTQAAYIRGAFKVSAKQDEEASNRWVKKHGIGDVDDCFLWGVDFHEEQPDEGQTMPTFVFSSDGEGVPDHVAELVAASQTGAEDTRPWSLESAFTCDKAREDGFGGSAVIVHNGVCKYFGTQQWVREQLKNCTGE